MASYFGEIIEPTTRAIFDDSSDEEEIAEPFLELSWSNGDQKPPSVLDVIFVFHGRLSLGKISSNLKRKIQEKQAFAEAFLLDETTLPTGEIQVYENPPKDSDYRPKKHFPSRIYIEGDKAMCLVSPTCSSELAYDFTMALSCLFKVSKKVIIFTNDSIHNYKALSLNKLPPAFIRQLKTTYNLDCYIEEKLPAPNFIIGIPAGILSWCEIFKKDASGFICYADQEKLDSITAQPFLHVLQKLPYFNVIKNYNPNYQKECFYGQPQIIGGSSNIYI